MTGDEVYRTASPSSVKNRRAGFDGRLGADNEMLGLGDRNSENQRMEAVTTKLELRRHWRASRGPRRKVRGFGPCGGQVMRLLNTFPPAR
jgi:hypothetical protein